MQLSIGSNVGKFQGFMSTAVIDNEPDNVQRNGVVQF